MVHETTGNPDSSAPAGFRSEADKRRFVTIAGILGGVFFIVQVTGPMVIAFLAMPAVMFTGMFTEYDVTNAAWYQETLYVVETKLQLRNDGQSSRLVRLAGDTIEEVTDLDGWEPRLLAEGETLWLVTSSRVETLVDGELTRHPVAQPLGDICRPFLFRGRPAVVEHRPDGGRLMSWTGDGWEAVQPLPQATGRCGFQPLAVGDEDLWLFKTDGDTLYVLEVGTEERGWNVVLSEPAAWYAFIRDGRPAVATTRAAQGFGIVEHDGERWTSIDGATGPRRLTSGLAVFPEDDGERLTVVKEGFPGNLTVRTWANGELGEARRFGKAFPFPPGMTLIVTLPHLATTLLSLLLAVILSSLMSSHRITHYRYQGTEARYASLVQRAVAQIVDGLITILPLSFVFWWTFGGFTEIFGEGPESFLRIFTWLGLAALWTVAVFVAFSFSEGRFGLTPGKWLVGIRVVGTDLAPCGFARALLRNFLKFVDGFFNYLVGILLIAFTPEWQRVGDMASRTIVVRIER